MEIISSNKRKISVFLILVTFLIIFLSTLILPVYKIIALNKIRTSILNTFDYFKREYVDNINYIANIDLNSNYKFSLDINPSVYVNGVVDTKKPLFLADINYDTLKESKKYKTLINKNVSGILCNKVYYTIPNDEFFKNIILAILCNDKQSIEKSTFLLKGVNLINLHIINDLPDEIKEDISKEIIKYILKSKVSLIGKNKYKILFSKNNTISLLNKLEKLNLKKPSDYKDIINKIKESEFEFYMIFNIYNNKIKKTFLNIKVGDFVFSPSFEIDYAKDKFKIGVDDYDYFKFDKNNKLIYINFPKYKLNMVFLTDVINKSMKAQIIYNKNDIYYMKINSDSMILYKNTNTKLDKILNLSFKKTNKKITLNHNIKSIYSLNVIEFVNFGKSFPEIKEFFVL